MTAPVRRRGGAGGSLTTDQIDWLRGGEGGDWGSAWFYFDGGGDPPSPAELWAAHRGWFVAEHAAEYPGTRPVRWWELDAPEPRRRVGGTGTPCHERLGHVRRLHLGVPMDWITAATLRTYERIDTPLGVPAIDPADAPTFESEAAYLDRLGLLRPGERRKLTDADFVPESVLDIFDFDLTEPDP